MPAHKPQASRRAAEKQGPSMDRARHLEDAKHHPIDNPLPHPPHKTLKKPPLTKKHTPHSHAHQEELGPHTQRPGPIKAAETITDRGTRKKK